MVWYAMWLYVCDAHYVSMHMVEEKELGVCWVWQPIWSAYRIKRKVEAKNWKKDKYHHFISILLCMWFMTMVYDDYMWSMILVYDGYMWFMILIYDGCVLSQTNVICLYMMIWSKILVWLVVIGSKQDCKCILLTSYQWGMIWSYFNLFWV